MNDGGMSDGGISEVGGTAREPRARAGGAAGIAIVIAGIALSWSSTGRAQSPAATMPAVAPVWMSPAMKGKELDSPAVWRGANGQVLVITTAKLGNSLIVIDGVTGKLIRTVGTAGLKLGQLGRPNGVAVWGDLAIVVERDNQRLSVFQLPSFKPIGFYADTFLIKPYGLAVRALSATTAELWVTDNQDLSPYPELHAATFRRRIKQFALTRTSTGLAVSFVRAFGDTLHGGQLRAVESIGVDPGAEELLVADEKVGDLNRYTTSGRFIADFAKKHFHGEPEGLALVSCGAKEGYWIATDQSKKRNRFHLFARGTYRHLGMFAVSGVTMTDGIAIQPGVVGKMRGALYVLNNDDNVAAVSLESVWAALGKPEPCPLGGVVPPAPVAPARRAATKP